MAFSLEFSHEFFMAEGEPYDRSDLALNADGNPVSVWSAVCKLKIDKPDVWAEMARDIFECEPEHLTEAMVQGKIQTTDTCLDLRSPITVYIDQYRSYSIQVWDPT